MNLNKLFQSTVIKRFHELGFNCEKSSRSWIFTREINGNKDVIEITKSDWEKNALRLSFLKAGKIVNSFYFLNSSVKQDFHYYTDEKSLQDLLALFIKITEDYALEWFKQNTTQNLFVSENFFDKEGQEKLSHFITKNKLNFEGITSILKLEEVVKRINSKDDIILASQFFGNFIIENFGGEWKKDKSYGLIICNIGGIQDFNRKPYKIISDYASDPIGYSISRHYKAIQDTVSSLNSSS